MLVDDRAFSVIPTAQLLETEEVVILSSDWDAGPLPPLGTIERALTRDTNAVLFDLDPEEIDEATILFTVVGGRIVYEAPGFDR